MSYAALRLYASDASHVDCMIFSLLAYAAAARYFDIVTMLRRYSARH